MVGVVYRPSVIAWRFGKGLSLHDISLASFGENAFEKW
jgi:hypothetical protein